MSLAKWYRCCHPRGRISSPDEEITLSFIKQVLEEIELVEPKDLKGWEVVPGPSPLHSNLDYVYTIDRDAGAFIISLWRVFDGSLAPTAIHFDLSRIFEAPGLFISLPIQKPKYSFDEMTDEVNGTQFIPLATGTLDIDFGMPAAMNELQEQFFIDFVFLWRFYVDDPLTWRHGSPAFKALSIAFLRLAAWDFELSFDSNVELPIYFASVPTWSYPEGDVYWFHGYLIVLQEDIRSEVMTNKALLKAKSYIADSEVETNDVRLILISPFLVAFAAFSHNSVVVSKRLTLLNNLSATKCSPGFRALSRILTSRCWNKPHAHREKWQYKIPPEIFQAFLHEMEPRDALSFSQASFVVQQYYYSSIPQFKDIVVQEFKSTIPCCGRRVGLEEQGICCSKCYSWQHMICVDLENWSVGDDYICVSCQENTALDPGGINRASCRKARQGCPLKLGQSEKALQLRLSKPSHLRPELRFIGNLYSVPPCLIDYTILFNHSFSGLAYGLDDRIRSK